MPDERLTYTVPEAAQLLGVSRGVAYSAVKTGELPSIRLGRRVLVSRNALMSLLKTDDPGANGVDGTRPEDARHAPSS